MNHNFYPGAFVKQSEAVHKKACTFSYRLQTNLYQIFQMIDRMDSSIHNFIANDVVSYI